MSMLAAAQPPGLVRGVQERAAKALPAVLVKRVNGWWLRHTDSSAWWTGAVLPHGDAPPAELASRIRLAENFYAGYGTPTRFQITPGACPAGLDHALAERGYRLESPMSLQSAPSRHVIDRLPPGTTRIRLDDQPTDAWCETWLAVHGTESDQTRDRAMLHRVHLPSAYATARTEAGVIAVGRAVAEAGWTGVFGMATLPDARGRGAATAVLAALVRWADDHRAGHIYLQVERDNAGARHLYERAGFTELCQYHYRTDDRRLGGVSASASRTVQPVVALR